MKPHNIKKNGFTPLCDTASPLIDPILRKRAGISVELIEAWSQIVGDDIAKTCLPLRINWRKRASQYDCYEPATLVVACEGFSAISIQHQSMEIIQRINVFFGFHAIDRLKIEQKPVNVEADVHINQKVIDRSCIAKVEEITADIALDGLRESLKEMGYYVLSQTKIGK